MAKGHPSIVVVTGGNRGIGFEICRQLAGRGAQVILTARKSEAGRAAVKQLATQNLGVQFHPLDVTAAKSIRALKNFLERTHGRLDVLVNNAGVIAKGDASGLDVDLATIRATLETNTLAPLQLSQALAPLLRRGKSPRIVNISSGMGSLSEMQGDHAAYRMSKAALNAVTTILAVELHGIVAVNSASPGWVRTDMGGPDADRDVAEGAATPVWLALDAPQRLTGKFLHDRKVIPW